MTTTGKHLWIAAAAMLLSATGAHAAGIAVANSSFELPSGPLPNTDCGPNCSYSFGDPIPGWTTTGDFGQFRPGPPTNVDYFNSVPDGITVAFTGVGTISQVVGATAQAGVTYTLQVDLGFRKDMAEPGIIELLVGGNPIVATGVADQFSGDWATYTAIYTATGADVGAEIEILLTDSSEAGQANYDNVRLSDNLPVPEPASLVLLGSALLGFGVVRRRRRVHDQIAADQSAG